MVLKVVDERHRYASGAPRNTSVRKPVERYQGAPDARRSLASGAADQIAALGPTSQRRGRTEAAECSGSAVRNAESVQLSGTENSPARRGSVAGICVEEAGTDQSPRDANGARIAPKCNPRVPPAWDRGSQPHCKSVVDEESYPAFDPNVSRACSVDRQV